MTKFSKSNRNVKQKIIFNKYLYIDVCVCVCVCVRACVFVFEIGYVYMNIHTCTYIHNRYVFMSGFVCAGVFVHTHTTMRARSRIFMRECARALSYKQNPNKPNTRYLP